MSSSNDVVVLHQIPPCASSLATKASSRWTTSSLIQSRTRKSRHRARGPTSSRARGAKARPQASVMRQGRVRKPRRAKARQDQNRQPDQSDAKIGTAARARRIFVGSNIHQIVTNGKMASASEEDCRFRHQPHLKNEGGSTCCYTSRERRPDTS